MGGLNVALFKAPEWQETASGEPSNPPLRRSELSSCDWSMVRGVSGHDKD